MNYGMCYCKLDFSEDGKSEGAITAMKYLGKGKWKCPECSIIEDHSDIIYNVRINVYEEEGAKVIDVLKPFDARLMLPVQNEHPGRLDKDAMEEDLNDYDIAKKHEIGTFDCEILWNWYRCSHECEEYDLDILILTEDRVEVK